MNETNFFTYVQFTRRIVTSSEIAFVNYLVIPERNVILLYLTVVSHVNLISL